MSHTRLVHDPDGLNTGVWPDIQPGGTITPLTRFFTRSHAAVPALDPRSWRLEVGGLVRQQRSFTLGELVEEFPERRVTATLVCAGMRRSEFLSLGPLPGELPWGPECASTGEWSGVALADVLQAVGIDESVRHVEFTGLDRVERQGHHFGFGGSIDLAKALGGGVLLATRLNGTPLPPAHGFPVRALVPGWIGARSVKWLGRITLSRHSSQNYFQAKAYRVQREVDPDDPRNVTAGIPMRGVPVNSVIASPLADTTVPAGSLRLRGWAIGGEGAAIQAVEVRAGLDAPWSRATLLGDAANWVWSFWEAELTLPRGKHLLMVRAMDTAGNTQPAEPRETWNVKGYGNNAWHRVAVEAV